MVCKVVPVEGDDGTLEKLACEVVLEVTKQATGRTLGQMDVHETVCERFGIPLLSLSRGGNRPEQADFALNAAAYLLRHVLEFTPLQVQYSLGLCTKYTSESHAREMKDWLTREGIALEHPAAQVRE